MLSRRLTEAADAFLAAGEGRPATDAVPTPWYGENRSLSIEAATCLLIGEQLMHGHDIAQTVGARWPIDRRQAELVMHAVIAMFPLMPDPRRAAAVDGAFDIRIRGGERFVLRMHDGAVTVEPSRGQRVAYRPALIHRSYTMMYAGGRGREWRAVEHVRGLPGRGRHESRSTETAVITFLSNVARDHLPPKPATICHLIACPSVWMRL